MAPARRVWWLVAVALLPASCATSSHVERADAIGHVRLTNFKVAAPRSITHGRVRFEIAGGGPSMHELVVTRTDLPAGDLARAADGTVTEDDAQAHPVDEAEGIDAGDHRDLFVTLRPGHYVLYCNMEGHYGAGMHTDLTVR
jgi:uncharacterized cupredoxin-like copper-binding protein